MSSAQAAPVKYKADSHYHVLGCGNQRVKPTAQMKDS